jgi:MFS family permease
VARDIRRLVSVLAVADVRRIWFAQMLSELGDWAARVALAVLVFDRTGSAPLTGLVTAVSMLPWVGLGQALATLGDRFPRRSVMVAADLMRATLFAVMALPIPIWALFLAAFAAAVATPPFESSRAAVLPEIVPEERFGDALALSSLTYQAMLMIGYLAGGGLVAVLSPRTALLVNAGTFLASALVLARLRGGRARHRVETVRKQISEAARAFLGDRLLLRAALFGAFAGSCAIVGEALVAVYARQEVAGGDAVVGLLAAFVPAGTIVGGLLVPRAGDHRMLLRAAAALVLVGSAGGIGGYWLGPDLPGAAVPFFAIGVVFALVIPAGTVVGSRLPNEVRASAFGLLQGLMLGGQALGAIAGGAIAAAVGAARASAYALVPAALYAAYALAHVPRDARPVEVQTPADAASPVQG